jgi:rhamnosyltransferase
MDADWVLLMDDDSSAGPNMVEQLAQANQLYEIDPRSVILVPKYLEQSVNREAKFVTAPGGKYHRPRFAKQGFSGQPVLQNLFIAISSGSLIKAQLFEQIGMIRESFDIDYLDVDFCLRAIRAGFRIVAVRDAELHHNLGEQTKHQILGRHFFAWNHSARRRFTIYRNRTRIWREYLFRFPGFVIFDALAAVMDLFRIVMFEQQKSAKLRSLLKGVWLGLFSRDLGKQAAHAPARNVSVDAASDKLPNE